MYPYKAVGVKELKNNLSAYLREVKVGFRILITEHRDVIAEITSPSPHSAERALHPILEGWVQSGQVRLPLNKRKEGVKIPHSPLRRPDGTSARLLDEDRGE